MDYQLDLIALGTSCLGLYFVLRAKKTYFLDSGFFIGVANVGFIILLLATTIADATKSPLSQVIVFPLISVMATSIGVASYLLGRSDDRNRGGVKEFTEFCLRPPIAFVAYLLVVASWTFSTLLAQPWVLNRIMTSTGSIVYFYSYPAWYLVASIILLASFIFLPVTSFYRQALIAADKKASTSMKILSVSWGLFGVITFQTTFLESIVPLSQSIGLIADSFLFVLNSFALREPTILGRIITAGETVSQAVYSHLDADTIVLYNTESDRRKLIETVVNDGLTRSQDVVCYVTKAEIPFYRAVLRGSGIATPSKNGRHVIIQPVEPSQSTDLPSVPLGVSRIRRELVDLGELDSERSKQFIARIGALDDVHGSDGSGRIWALNVDGAAGVLSILTEINPDSRIIDLARQQDSFSSLLSLRHQNILGNRLLLEFEPASNYEEIVQKFVREFQANVEPVAIFTSMGSPIYRQFRHQRNIRLFSFSAKTSTPVKLSDQQVLLPERDTSLLLDAVDKLLQTHFGQRMGVVFDVFTDMILSQSFEKAYGVISSVVEMSESEFSSILVLVNCVALEERALNGLRGLFRSEARVDTLGFRTIRLHGSELQPKAGGEELLIAGEPAAKGVMPS